MATLNNKPKTIEEYIASFPKEAKHILEELRQAVKESAPQAEESISYGMPTFKLCGKRLAYFAAWKSHVGFYPGTAALEAFKQELAPFKQAKGSVQFPYAEPIPLELVKRIVKFKAQENQSRM
jgi:uncharacterized protein YdhG (YjbR/CyaY superfamily)